MKKVKCLHHTDTILPVPLQVPQVLSILNMPVCTNVWTYNKSHQVNIIIMIITIIIHY